MQNLHTPLVMAQLQGRQPGYIVADAVGASAGGILWWVLMVVNSLVWGAVLSLFVFPFIRKILK